MGRREGAAGYGEITFACAKPGLAVAFVSPKGLTPALPGQLLSNCVVSPQCFNIGGILHRADSMKYAILRTQKLKSGQAVRRSLTHAFREQETPNADASRTPENTHMGAANAREALDRFNELMPEKVRKNAVLAVEYLITASPEAMQNKSREQQDGYFADALDWLKAKHGAENVFYAGIHRDEMTPHMYAYVVPKDAAGKLNCRAFLGGAKALSEMQTDFAEKVGRPHGLERGLERSRARHTSIKEYYGRVQAAERPVAAVDVPEPSLAERLNPSAYGHRVANSVLQQIGPDWMRMQAKAIEVDKAKEEVKAAKAAQQDLEKRLAPIVTALRPLNDQERQQLVMVVDRAKEHLLGERMKARMEQPRQRAEDRRTRREDRGMER